MQRAARLQRLVILLVACALCCTTLLHASAQDGKKDTFVFGRTQDSITLDPAQITYNVDIWIINNIFDQLVRVDPTSNAIIPGLAEKWDISDDQKTYTFTLRDGLKFSDGTPLLSTDVKWSLDRARDPDQSSFYNFSLSPISFITTPDEKTVVINLTDASSAFLAPLAMFNASVLPQAYFEQVGPEAFASAPIGSGPYQVKDWQKGTSLTLTANPNYWGPAPLTPNITLVSVPDDNTRIQELEAGTLDAAEYIPLSRVSSLPNDPKVAVNLFPSTYVQSLLFNTRNPPLNDVNARLALAYATDYSALLKIVTFGFGTVANSYMSPSTPFYDKDLAPYSYDLQKAKDYLSKSATPTGFDITLSVVRDNVTDQEIATAVQQMYAKIGVKVAIEQLDQSARDDKYNKADFEMLTSYWTDDMVDADEGTTYQAYYPSSGSMQSGFNDDATNKQILAARTETDPVRRAQLYAAIQQTIHDQAPFLPLYYKPFAVGVSRKVQGLKQLSLGTYVFSGVTVDS